MTRTIDIAAVLKNVPLFSMLSEAELSLMLPSMQQRSYAARAAILRAGEAADGLYVVLSGRVRLRLADGNGHEIIVSEFGAADLFGEVGLIDGSTRLGDVHALQACEILFIPRTTVLDCLEGNPAAALSLLSGVLDRLGDGYRKIGMLALIDVYGRVARVLLEAGSEVRGEWLVQPGSEQIAAMVGASREMVSRVVKSMINQGLVRRYKRKLIVLDRAALAARNGRARAHRRQHASSRPLSMQGARSPQPLV